ncbi:hypothetical protein DHEL01_v206259 [Diaporthe helianthi]|uniref:Heterokaryon incompatibility domain-containing protein n=1 Tax=Diaporthe helianthi TaxID=158607 RepID=A0A2P5HYM3_DIAHE|nr:hypothetical protein DHEL01_v206259 [Diaporthe helianthi]
MAALIEYSPPETEEILKVKQLSKDLFELTLTRHNKSNLFSQAIANLDAGHEEANLILQNLNSWSPQIGADFHPRTSTIILDTPFRLICSSPKGIPLDSAFVIRQYLAVSYSWHSAEWPEGPPPPTSSPPHEPGQGSSIWPIGQRFADAVLSLRGHPREGIWIDQVCIDQAPSSDEKQRAIACMDIVYKSCRRLVVVLEDVELSDDEAAAAVLHVCAARDDDPDLPTQVPAEADVPVLVSLFGKVARARWWRRAWCFHEFVVGEPWSTKRHQDVHNTVFVMGHGEGRTVVVGWLALQSLLSDVILKVDHVHGSPDSMYINPILSGLDDRTSPLLDSPDRKPGATRSSFMARYNSVSLTGCSKAGDKLSICINLLGIGLAYVPKVEPTVDEVYYLAVMIALAAGEKAPLCFASKEPLMLGGKQSWLMRPIIAADTTLRKFALGTLGGIHSVSSHRLELDLLVFRHSFKFASDEEINRTYEIFPDAIKSTPPPLKFTWHSAVQSYRTDEEMEKPRRQFLATVLAGGRGLARRLWAQLDRDVVRYNYNTGIFADFQANVDLRLNADKFLEILNTNGSEVTDCQDDFSSDAALAFLTWVTDPRSIYWISWRTLRAPCSRDGEMALLSGFCSTSNFNFVDPGLAPAAITVAVPTDLVEADCSLTRAWVLMQVEGGEGTEVAWKVVAKCLLLGNTDLAEEVKRIGNDEQSQVAVELRTRQVVLG